MKTKFFRNNAFVKASALVNRFLGKLAMTVVLLCPVVLAAQNGVTVSNLNVIAGTVTFNVSWDKTKMPVELWSDTVWVFVDYNDKGVMKRLPLTGATLTNPSASAATATVPLPNNKGAWVAGSARSAGSFSAKVKLYYDSQTAVAGACAYASNYPPVGEYITVETIKFTGTPMYDLVLKHSGGSMVTQQVNSPFNVPSSCTLQTFTDKTGAPGIIIPKPISLTANPAVICKGASATLTAVAAGAASYSFDNGVTWQAGATKVVSPTADTTYTLKVLSATSYVSLDSKTATMTVNALPTNPIGVNNSRCGDGTVTISATSSGAVIDWYAATSGGSSVSTGTSYTTPNITATKTYYAQARISATGCVSASRTAVTATRNNVPAIARSGGAASQTVDANVSITNIVYTASNGATAIALSSGSWPSGITGATSGLSYTIAGKTWVAGTTNYTIKATGEGSCTYTTSGAITVNAYAPPLAASTQTWVITGNGITQIWSDRINVPVCDKDSYVNDNSNPQCRSHTLNSVKYYYYNWPYVNANQTTMCPPGSNWRVPTKDDFVALDIALGGNGVNNRAVTPEWFQTTYMNTWHGEFSGHAEQGQTPGVPNQIAYWSTMHSDEHFAYGLQYAPDELTVYGPHWKPYGLLCRCVR